MESGVNTHVHARGCYGIRDISRWRHMLITAPYRNNIITRAHPTIILVTRDRLLLSTFLQRYSGKLLRSRESTIFEPFLRLRIPFSFLSKFKFNAEADERMLDVLENCSAVFRSPPFFFLFEISHQRENIKVLYRDIFRENVSKLSFI